MVMERFRHSAHSDLPRQGLTSEINSVVSNSATDSDTAEQPDTSSEQQTYIVTFDSQNSTSESSSSHETVATGLTGCNMSDGNQGSGCKISFLPVFSSQQG